MGDLFDIRTFFYSASFDHAGDVWTEAPTTTGIFIYSVLTPTICLCGMVGNVFCLVVLTKKQFVCSFYVYLFAISIVDLALCVVTFLSGLARGALWWRDGWATYDAIVSIPLGGVLSCLSTIATVFVTVDRLIYLKNPLQLIKPKFCKRKTALKVLCCGTVVSILCTLPYCFIYTFAEDGTLETTSFYKSSFYAFYTWFDFTLFAILPLQLLLVGNIMLIMSIRYAHKIQKKSELLKGKICKIKYQSKLTATLIAIVFFYLIGEVPTHVTARKTAANILFGGDEVKAGCSVALEIGRQVTTVLNALHLASKFILYCYFCPPLAKELKATIMGRPAKQKQIEATNVPVKLCFVGDADAVNANTKFEVDLNQLGFMNIFINAKATQELPRLI